MNQFSLSFTYKRKLIKENPNSHHSATLKGEVINVFFFYACRVKASRELLR